MRRIAQTVADGVGPTEWLEMDGEKKPLVMSELGCADGCGRQMGGENGVDGGRRGCKEVAGNGWGKWVQRTARKAVDGVGKLRGGNSWGEEAAGDERAWLRGRLRTGNGRGEVRRRLRTASVQGSGWKWVGRRSRC